MRAEDSMKGDTSLFEEFGPYVDYETAKNYINMMSRWTNETAGQGVEFLKQFFIDEMGKLRPFNVRMVRKSAIADRVLEINNILRQCDYVAMDDAIRAVEGKYVSVESHESLKNELRKKEEEIRKLKERLNSEEASEAKQEFPPYNRS